MNQTNDIPQFRGEETEKRFKDFTDRLLNAEQYTFAARDVFTPARLCAILTQFCNIIADEVSAQSCTIQLKLYDLRDLADPAIVLKTPQGTTLKDQVKKLPWYEGAGENLQKDMIRAREKSWGSTTAFPYPFFPKSAVKLVAVNQASPWYSYQDDARLTTLIGGVTADIMQDRTARVRDPLSIRVTRQMRKLGTFDDQIWVGDSPDALFYNYYGVPIRIHAAGEAIGLLKVENKGVCACAQMFWAKELDEGADLKTVSPTLPSPSWIQNLQSVLDWKDGPEGFEEARKRTSADVESIFKLLARIRNQPIQTIAGGTTKREKVEDELRGLPITVFFTSST